MENNIIGDIKRNRNVNIVLQDFIRLHIEKNEPVMFTANKIYENIGPEMKFSGLKKNDISKNQSLSGDSFEQDINLVWPNIQIMLKKWRCACPQTLHFQKNHF
jgi:hypothetical protein